MSLHPLYGQGPEEKEDRDRDNRGSQAEAASDRRVVMEPWRLHRDSPLGFDSDSTHLGRPNLALNEFANGVDCSTHRTIGFTRDDYINQVRNLRLHRPIKRCGQIPGLKDSFAPSSESLHEFHVVGVDVALFSVL